MKHELNGNWPYPSQFFDLSRGKSGSALIQIHLANILKKPPTTEEMPIIPEGIKGIIEKFPKITDLTKNIDEIRGIMLHKLIKLTMLKNARTMLMEFLIFLLNNEIYPAVDPYANSTEYSIIGLINGIGDANCKGKLANIREYVTSVDKEMKFPGASKNEMEVLATKESSQIVPLFLKAYSLNDSIAKIIASFTTLIDYAGVGDGLLKEEKLTMGRGGKNLAYVVSSITSMLEGRKLQGAGIKEVSQDMICNFVDIASYSKGVFESTLDYAKNVLTSEIDGNENAFKLSFENNIGILYLTLRQLNSVIHERLSAISKVIPTVKEIELVPSMLQEMIKKPTDKPVIPTEFSILNIAKETDILYSLSVSEFIHSFLIFASEPQEEPQKEEKKPVEEDKKEGKKEGKKESKKKEKKDKKKINHGKGSSELMLYLASLKWLNKSEMAKSMNEFCKIYLSDDLTDKVSEEMTSHNEAKRIPKIPKGTRDSDPLDMAIKNLCIDTIKGVFKSHGAMEIDTPVFELKETLMGKYGEESKLIYDLADQGGELLSLRYDLTVSFARYMAVNKLQNFKRYHIGKVYRRDNPVISKGRYREFYQCDYDIAGSYSPMIPEAEILSTVSEVLKKLGVNDFVTIINHRGLLNAMVELSGCDTAKFKTICSSIDKLDKSPWEEVCAELINVKGLSKEQAENLHKFTELKGKPRELLKYLKENGIFAKHKEAPAILDQMEILASYTEALGIENTLLFDLSLARGLDYYTGMIFEVKLKDPKLGVGSIAGGGRYDNLIGIFSAKQIPSVGFSFGIERLFTIMAESMKGKIRACPSKILVASVGKDMTIEKMKICRELWDNGIEAELMYFDNPKPQKQLSHALENEIPIMVWVGEDEVKQGLVKIKIMSSKEETMVKRPEMLAKIKETIKKF